MGCRHEDEKVILRAATRLLREKFSEEAERAAPCSLDRLCLLLAAELLAHRSRCHTDWSIEEHCSLIASVLLDIQDVGDEDDWFRS